jgi:hypothetical protein
MVGFQKDGLNADRAFRPEGRRNGQISEEIEQGSSQTKGRKGPKAKCIPAVAKGGDRKGA